MSAASHDAWVRAFCAELERQLARPNVAGVTFSLRCGWPRTFPVRAELRYAGPNGRRVYHLSPERARRLLVHLRSLERTPS